MGPRSAIYPHGATVGHNCQISTRVGLRSLPWVTETERADSMAGRWSVRNRFNHAHTHATSSLINFSKIRVRNHLIPRHELLIGITPAKRRLVWAQSRADLDRSRPAQPRSRRPRSPRRQELIFGVITIGLTSPAVSVKLAPDRLLLPAATKR